MPIAAPRGVTSSSLSNLAPIPLGIADEAAGAGLMGLIRKLLSEDVADKVNPAFGKESFARNLISDMTDYLKDQGIATDPGVNVLPLGLSKGKQLIYMGPKGDVIGAAIVNELPDAPGSFFTSEFGIDKSKGMLAGKAAASLGKKILEMGAGNINTTISTDTYKLLQHLAKLVK